MSVPGRLSRSGVSVIVVAAVLGVVLSGSVSAGADARITVRVDARDYSFKLSRRAVPAGSTVRFVVRNRGSTIHDFVVNGRRTRILRPGQRQSIAVQFRRKGVYRFLCSVPGHALLGMKGTFSVAKKPAPAPPPPPPVDVSDLAVLTRIGTFGRPVLVTAPPGDARRLFVVDQTGYIHVVRDGEALATPFLDIHEKVRISSEAGLLSTAFAPDYAVSGRFYVFYNANQGNGDIRISEFRRHPIDPDLADPYSERVVLTIPKPWENHNGGMLQFGPDGYLYASVGDGDSGIYTPQGFFAQRRDELLADVIRIDPGRGDPYTVPADNPFLGIDGVRPEIWAYGLRNPWRFWIDSETGAMFIGDAGNARREEVDLVPQGSSGLNFGWPCLEGTLPFDETTMCDQPVAPLFEVPRENGVCALIGGVVIRDSRLPELVGRYLYGEFCTGKLTAVRVENAKIAESKDLELVLPELSSFGTDGLGRVYVMSIRGSVFRLDPRPRPS